MTQARRVQVRNAPVAKHVGLSNALQSRVLLEKQIEAAGCLVTALEDRAVLEGVWVTAPAIKDVVVIPCHGLHAKVKKNSCAAKQASQRYSCDHVMVCKAQVKKESEVDEEDSESPKGNPKRWVIENTFLGSAQHTISLDLPANTPRD